MPQVEHVVGDLLEVGLVLGLVLGLGLGLELGLANPNVNPNTNPNTNPTPNPNQVGTGGYVEWLHMADFERDCAVNYLGI